MKRDDLLIAIMLLEVSFGAVMLCLGYVLGQDVYNADIQNVGDDIRCDCKGVQCCGCCMACGAGYNQTPESQDICEATSTSTATTEGCYSVCPMPTPTMANLRVTPTSPSPPQPTNTDAPEIEKTAIPPTLVEPNETLPSPPTSTSSPPEPTSMPDIVDPTATDVPSIFCHCEQGEGAEDLKNCHPAQHNPGHAKHEWDYWSDDGTCDGWYH